MKKENENKIEGKKDFRKMLLDWQQNDLVKAGSYYHYIERENKDAFARGWRYALWQVIGKLDEFNL